MEQIKTQYEAWLRLREEYQALLAQRKELENLQPYAFELSELDEKIQKVKNRMMEFCPPDRYFWLEARPFMDKWKLLTRDQQ